MAQSDARFGYKANLGREDFDLSQPLGLTSAAGMLLPVWFDYASPGDSYYIQHDLPLLRSMQLAAPAMINVKVHFETFFVPMQMLYQPFENVTFSLNNIQSSNYTASNLQNNNFPLFDYSSFISTLKSSYAASDYRSDAFRLADLLGLDAMNMCTATTSPSTDPTALNGLMQYSPSFFPWQILAYHTIFQYYYRLDDKSQFSNANCNWDKYYSSSSAVAITDPAFMVIHQRPWDFDYFTSMYRSPIVSDDNLQSVLSNRVYGDLVNMSTHPIDSSGIITGSTPNSDYEAFSSGIGATYSASVVKQGFNTALIRQMFANEKLAMITGRTKKNYDSQVLAHYGVNVPHDVKHDLTMVHHDVYDLNVQEVTNLAASSSNPLGELAGKSYATGYGKQFKFTAPCHGVMMTILSVEPKKRYFGGFDRINAITNTFDFPVPEFDRLGNTPMYRYETGMLPQSSGYNFTDLIGWKERYYQFKRKYPKTTLAFGHSITGTTINNYSPYMLAFRPFGLYNSGSAFTGQAPRPDLENRFYIERSAVDSLCLVNFSYGWLESSSGENWSVTPWLLYARDPFIINSNIKAKKVSWMSKDGEPIYNW